MLELGRNSQVLQGRKIELVLGAAQWAQLDLVVVLRVLRAVLELMAAQARQLGAAQ